MKQFILFSIFCLTIGCSTSKKLPTTTVETLNQKITNSPVFQQGFTGFVLFDPATNQTLESIHGNKFFTPASNTKTLTYFATNLVLEDSIPALKYMIRGDSLIFAGTGDPSFLNDAFFENDKALDFLKNRKEKLFFTPSNFNDDRYGSGWMWDDYPYSFQAEKSPFPIYGNTVKFEKATANTTVEITPKYFEKATTFVEKEGQSPVVRKEFSNEFEVNLKAITQFPYERKMPFIYSDTLLVKLLSAEVGKPITLLENHAFPTEENQMIYSTHTDSLFQKLMRDSDNHIAEQLLLITSDAVFGNMNAADFIQFAKDSLMKDLEEKPLWADGSGVSRYNKITPNQNINFLTKIYQTTPFAALKKIFPTGGVNGTIEDWYPGNPPYVFAKTGTLRGVHCLSGYLETKSGRQLIFSFMHNNFPFSSSNLKTEMQVMLEWIRDNYD